MDNAVLIVETGPGWVCANAGIDESNSLDDDRAILLPEDPDASAVRLRAAQAPDRAPILPSSSPTLSAAPGAMA